MVKVLVSGSEENGSKVVGIFGDIYSKMSMTNLMGS
jgi:hypothetical protein